MSFEWQPDPYPGLPLDGHMVDAGKEAHTKIHSEEQGKREEGTGMDLWIPGAWRLFQHTDLGAVVWWRPCA